jgi:serine protease AprX
MYGSITLVNRFLTLLLITLLAAAPVRAGLTITGSSGIVATGIDGVSYSGTSGITATGIDGLLAFTPNGITATGIDGISDPGASGITATGIDGVAYVGPNGITATGIDMATMAAADGITATGIDGLTITTVGGTVYRADEVRLVGPSGITATGIDGITATGIDGFVLTSPTSATIERADGITATGIDGITATGIDGITATGIDGTVFEIAPDGVTITGIDGITATGIDGITATGIDGITATGIDGITATGIDDGVGLQSVDPELALTLDALTDDRSVNAVIVYHAPTTDADVADLRAIGILGGTRFKALPAIVVTGTRSQILAISHLPAVRSIYGTRTLDTTADTSRSTTGVERAWADSDLASANAGSGLTGRGVTVAVIDTGVDGRHPDLAGRVARNLKIADLQSAPVGFASPPAPLSLVNTDLVYGHGTFVAGLVAGTGAASNGARRGVAPGARIVGLSAGDLTLLHVLSAFDYLLDHQAELDVRVVNCSFSANTVFDVNDPVNVATRMLVERGVNVVVSAGNTGPGWNTMNPYAVAPWVIGVGATDGRGKMAPFSSRGDFRSSVFRPKLVAPGVSLVSLRGLAAPNITGVLGLESVADTQLLTPAERVNYTTSSGTSFSAPQVAGTVALMLEANPSLTPGDVMDILQRTATPMPPYYQHEVGAGMLNAHAAALEAAFPELRLGDFRATMDRGKVTFIKDPAVSFGGTVMPGSGYQTHAAIPANTVAASLQIAWGPLLTRNDLALSAYDPGGALRGSSNAINLPGLTGRRERVTLLSPGAGSWRVRVANTLSLAGSPQAFTGTLEVARVEYAPVGDLADLSASSRDEIYQTMRSFVLSPFGRNFRPGSGVTRADLAAAMLVSARIPQYVPRTPTYTDVGGYEALLPVESAQAAPGGPLFLDAQAGGLFRPRQFADRVTAAIALVRAAGLGADAESRQGASLPGVSDAGTIPAQYRGYVAVALEQGFLTLTSGTFRPAAALTRAELAHAAVTVMNMATR